MKTLNERIEIMFNSLVAVGCDFEDEDIAKSTIEHNLRYTGLNESDGTSIFEGDVYALHVSDFGGHVKDIEATVVMIFGGYYLEFQDPDSKKEKLLYQDIYNFFKRNKERKKIREYTSINDTSYIDGLIEMASEDWVDVDDPINWLKELRG